MRTVYLWIQNPYICPHCTMIWKELQSKIPKQKEISKKHRNVPCFLENMSTLVFCQNGGQFRHGFAAGELVPAVDDGQGNTLDVLPLHQGGVQIGVDHVGSDQLVFPGDALGRGDQLAAVGTFSTVFGR